jgi:hypothetical protein
MGMAMGAFLFGIASLRYTVLVETARHCAVLGLIFVPPTIIAGILDWQHYYDGDWSGLFITKLVLAIVLPVLLLAAVAERGGFGVHRRRDRLRMTTLSNPGEEKISNRSVY